MDDNMWNASLEQILPSINQVLEDPEGSRRSPFLYMSIHGMVHNYCNAEGAFDDGKVELLYLQLKNHFKIHLTRVSESDEWEDEDNILSFFVAQWKSYNYSSTYLNNAFVSFNVQYGMHLQRFNNMCQESSTFVKHLALITWKEIILQTKFEELTRAILKRIENYRKGLEILDYGLIRDCIQPYLDVGYNLGLYQQLFEKQFLEKTELFYSNHPSLNFVVGQKTVCEYNKKIKKFQNSEYRLITLCLHNSTLKPVMEICEKIFIRMHSEPLSNEFLHSLREGNTNYLRILYNMICRSNMMRKRMLGHFCRYIKHQCETAMNEIDKAVLNVTQRLMKILNVHQRSCKIVAAAFCSDPGYLNKCDAICYKKIKVASKRLQSVPNPGHLLAYYCNSLFEKSSKNMDDVELELSVGHLIRLLKKYLDASNTVCFKRCFSRLFCDRLKAGKLVSDEAENSMIMKLGEMLGFDYACELRRKYQMLSLVKSDFPSPIQI